MDNRNRRPGKEWWHPEQMNERRPHLLARAKIIAAIRDHFARSAAIEVETPALQICPGVEIHLHPFETRLIDPWGGADRTLFLHTSPEFAMKKLLAAGWTDIFQLARVFRNGEITASHHPEFTMLEWYRAHTPLSALMSETETIVQAAARAADRDRLIRQGQSCDPFQPWERLSVADAFWRHCQIDILATAPDPHHPDTSLLAAQAQGIGLTVSPSDQWDDIFFKIMMDRIEPHLGWDRPVFLHSYPVSMAALARPDPRDPRVAERFEAYVLGLELCNAFGELTDPAEQQRRFQQDLAAKKRLYDQDIPVDQDFLQALSIMPDASGNALGLDRLVMLVTGADHIAQVLWAPVMS